MDEGQFGEFLKKGGRSQNAIRRALTLVKDFERYLQELRGGKPLEDANPEDLETFVGWVEQAPKASARLHLWALRYYYTFRGNAEIANQASSLRQARIERKPFPLKDFRGVDPEHVARLSAAGVRNAAQMLETGRDPGRRAALAEKTGIPVEAILELVKLSDLARIPGIKGIRARLYYDAGVDTIEKLAAWDPEALREMIVGFVERTGFEGIATLPEEARFAVRKAGELPRVVEY